MQNQHWSELRAVILVVSDKEKDTSSTSGMETSRLTSPLLQFRASTVVQKVCYFKFISIKMASLLRDHIDVWSRREHKYV